MVHLLLGVIYLAFISLGLPDSLLGSAWPSIYGELGVPVSFAGVISMIISAGTIVSSLGSDRLTPGPGPRPGDGLQCGFDGGGPVWIFHLHVLLDAVPVGGALWPGRRQCGRGPEQLCGDPLCPAGT